MAIAAVPNYLPADQFASASPGMRFSYLLSIWTTRGDQEQILRKKSEGRSQEAEQLREHLQRRGMDACVDEWLSRNRLPQVWQKNEDAAHSAWQGILKLSPADRATMTALATRQAGFAYVLQASGNLLRLETESVAPFATGLGNEHPLENGFAFLNPYGLPYLAGSGVKGVLRQAAWELASGHWGDAHGWRNQAADYPLVIDGKINGLSMIDVLFGRECEEGDTDHVRGALTFWDVFPQIKGHALHVEVMTPHQTHYYQRGENPHESGSPTPINFLTVPPGSGFAFHVQCDRPFLARLAPDLAQDNRWKTLMEAAFAHAFAWLGFGAKTAVGYGAMSFPASQGVPQQPGTDTSASSGSAVSPLETWTGVEVKLNAGNGTLTVNHRGQSASVRDSDARRLCERLPDDSQARLKKQKALKNCEVSVERIGNAWRIVTICVPGLAP